MFFWNLFKKNDNLIWIFIKNMDGFPVLRLNQSQRRRISPAKNTKGVHEMSEQAKETFLNLNLFFSLFRTSK